jgi:hypothetical protein
LSRSSTASIAAPRSTATVAGRCTAELLEERLPPVDRHAVHDRRQHIVIARGQEHFERAVAVDRAFEDEEIGAGALLDAAEDAAPQAARGVDGDHAEDVGVADGRSDRVEEAAREFGFLPHVLGTARTPVRPERDVDAALQQRLGVERVAVEQQIGHRRPDDRDVAIGEESQVRRVVHIQPAGMHQAERHGADLGGVGQRGVLHERLELGAAVGIGAALGSESAAAFAEMHQRGGQPAGVAIVGVEVEQVAPGGPVLLGDRPPALVWSEVIHHRVDPSGRADVGRIAGVAAEHDLLFHRRVGVEPVGLIQHRRPAGNRLQFADDRQRLLGALLLLQVGQPVGDVRLVIVIAPPLEPVVERRLARMPQRQDVVGRVRVEIDQAGEHPASRPGDDLAGALRERRRRTTDADPVDAPVTDEDVAGTRAAVGEDDAAGEEERGGIIGLHFWKNEIRSGSAHPRGDAVPSRERRGGGTAIGSTAAVDKRPALGYSPGDEPPQPP